MIVFREIISASFFFAAWALLFNLVFDTFDLFLLAMCIAFFIAAYFIWPSKKRGGRRDDSELLDAIEWIIEFPVEMLLWFVRIFGRLLFKGDGFDI